MGFKRSIAVSETKRIELETMSMRPLVLSVDGFLEDGECDDIISTAQPFVKASEVKLMDKDKGKVSTIADVVIFKIKIFSSRLWRSLLTSENVCTYVMLVLKIKGQTNNRSISGRGRSKRQSQDGESLQWPQ